MYGNTQDVLNATRTELPRKIELASAHFTENQRSLVREIAARSMANLSHKSDPNPNAERKWELPRVGGEVADILVRHATNNTIPQGNISDEQFRAFVASDRLRDIADEAKAEVIILLEQRARGR